MASQRGRRSASDRDAQDGVLVVLSRGLVAQDVRRAPQLERSRVRRQLAYGLGEDGWIEHLLNAPSVGMHADLLKVDMERRPSGALHDALEAKRADVPREELATHNARLVDGTQVFEGDVVLVDDGREAAVTYELKCRRHWMSGESAARQAMAEGLRAV